MRQPRGLPAQGRRPLRRPSRSVRIGLIQLGCAVGGGLLAVLAARASLGPQISASTVVPVMLTMGFSIVGLVTIIFSLLFTVVQWVYGAFSLRLRRFEEQSVTWWVFGLTIGIFVYTLAAVLLIGRADTVSWVVPGLTFVATLICLVLMRRVQLSAFTSVQLGPTLLDICRDGLSAVETAYPLPWDESGPQPGKSPTAHPYEITWPGRPAVVQQIDEPRLVAAAASGGTFIRLTVGVGGFVSPGACIAEVDGPDAEGARREVVEALVTGTSRTLRQDPLLPVRLLVDIALKALSPAINDPATAVQAMQCLTPILCSLSQRDLDTGWLTDPEGNLRVRIPVPTWEQIMAEALDDLVVCAAGLPLARRGLTELLEELSQQCPKARREAVSTRKETLAGLAG